jgi:hypothetical protein
MRRRRLWYSTNSDNIHLSFLLSLFNGLNCDIKPNILCRLLTNLAVANNIRYKGEKMLNIQDITQPQLPRQKHVFLKSCWPCCIEGDDGHAALFGMPYRWRVVTMLYSAG